MTDYVAYSDDLEVVPDNEDAQINDIVSYLQTTQKYPNKVSFLVLLEHP